MTKQQLIDTFNNSKAYRETKAMFNLKFEELKATKEEIESATMIIWKIAMSKDEELREAMARYHYDMLRA